LFEHDKIIQFKLKEKVRRFNLLESLKRINQVTEPFKSGNATFTIPVKNKIKS